MVAIEHGKGRLQITSAAHIIQLQLPRREGGNIRRIEEHPLRIQRIEIGHKVLCSEHVVVAPTRVVALFYHLDELFKGVPLLGAGDQRVTRQRSA